VAIIGVPETSLWKYVILMTGAATVVIVSTLLPLPPYPVAVQVHVDG
jgi:hypothetical protein